MATELAPTAPSEHRPDDVIAGRYVLGRKLGEGGMGVVWVARSLALDVDVALKMLRPELARAEAIERMAREARSAAQLGHPALVRVLDFGTSEQGEPFLAMELLQGEELHALLAREGRLSAERAAALLLPVIDGLGTAHEKGIVHRDIKPENIFIASDGQGRIQPKVLDFGIAKLDRSHVSTRLTLMGAVLGSPQYLSPEQAEGLDDVDHRSDIWSVGVLLYEMVTDTPPFEADNYNALIRRILRDEPRPTTELGIADAQFWTILERCFKKDPSQRWASMWELGEALALWLYERGIRVDAASRSIKHDWLDGGITGVQILVEVADGATLPPQPTEESTSVPLLLSPTIGAVAHSDFKPGERSWLPATIGAAAACAGLLVLTMSFRRAPVHTASEERGLGAVASPVVASVAHVIDRSLVARSAALTPAASVPAALPAPLPSASASPSLSTNVKRAAARRQVPPRAAVPRATPPKSASTEFGF